MESERSFSSLVKNREKLLADAFFICCLAVAFFLPFSVRGTTKSILLLCIIWTLQNNFKNILHQLKTNGFVWLFISLYLFSATALYYTENVKMGLWELEKAFCMLLFPVLFSSIKPLPLKRVHAIVMVFTGANLMFGMMCLTLAVYTYLTEGQRLFFYFDLVTQAFPSHPTYFSMYLIFSLIALVVFYRRTKQHRVIENILMVLFFCYVTVLIYLLSVRFIIILYTLSIIVIIVVYTIRSRRTVVGIVTLIFFIGAVAIIISKNDNLKERLAQLKDSYSYKMSPETMEGYNGLTTRLAQWECSVIIIKTSPVFGIGPGDVQDQLQQAYKDNFLKYSYRDRLNAHSQYFQTTMGLGIVGLAILLTSFGVSLYYAYRNKNTLHVLFIILFAICCITESMLFVQKGIVFFSFFNALFFFQWHADSTEKQVKLS